MISYGFPPQSSLFGCRFDRQPVRAMVTNTNRLNLACLAVGSTVCLIRPAGYSPRLNLACLAVGSTDLRENLMMQKQVRLNLACLAVGSTWSYSRKYS